MLQGVVLLQLLLLYCTQESAGDTPITPGPYRVTATSLIVRRGPGTNHPRVATVRLGRLIHVMEATHVEQTIESRKGRWLKVRLSAGEEGYALGPFLKRANPIATLPTRGDPDQSICAGIENYYLCAQAIEKVRLKQHLHRVSRAGSILSIKLMAGTTKQFSGTNEEKQKARHSFRAYFAHADLFLIEREYHEGGDFLLVNGLTGASTDLWDRPIFSPSRKSFAVASYDPEDHLAKPNGVQVFEVRNGKINLALERITKWGPWDLKWADEDSIVLTRVEWPPPTDSGYVVSRAELERSGGRWVLHE